MVLFSLCVDDLVVTRSIQEFQRQMMKEYDMIDLGKLTYYLEMEFNETSKGLVMHQKKCNIYFGEIQYVELQPRFYSS
jgi:hypothetical protein